MEKTLVCKVELHKQLGVKVTVNNKADNIVQTMVFDGTSITTTCQGSETSVIIQKPESVSINCKNFNVNAENINCQAAKEANYQSGSTTVIKGNLVKIN